MNIFEVYSPSHSTAHADNPIGSDPGCGAHRLKIAALARMSRTRNRPQRLASSSAAEPRFQLPQGAAERACIEIKRQECSSK